MLVLLAAGTLAAPLAFAEPCTRPAERAAFDVASLKSQLMVTALACDQRDKYNDFVIRFRRELMQQEHALRAYFSRSFGSRGQQQHDDYITLLANAQSEAGVHDGTLFCQRNAALLDEVLALPEGASLPGYAAAKALSQPIDLNDCRGGPPTQLAHNR
ncbi:MAG TPA: hypothetical protein VMB34_11660 [Acetobacteraceae bacterium]|nr:hypothetical protein [Acetobacteraceae bacterium]